MEFMKLYKQVLADGACATNIFWEDMISIIEDARIGLVDNFIDKDGILDSEITETLATVAEEAESLANTCRKLTEDTEEAKKFRDLILNPPTL